MATAVGTFLLSGALEDGRSAPEPIQFGVSMDSEINSLILPVRTQDFVQPSEPRFRLDLDRVADGGWHGRLGLALVSAPDLYVLRSSGAGSILVVVPTGTIPQLEDEDFPEIAGRCAFWEYIDDSPFSMAPGSDGQANTVVHQLEDFLVLECPIPEMQDDLKQFIFEMDFEQVPIEEEAASIGRERASLLVARSQLGVDGFWGAEFAPWDRISIAKIDVDVSLTGSEFGSSFPPADSGSVSERRWNQSDDEFTTEIQFDIEDPEARRRWSGLRDVLLLVSGGLISAFAGAIIAFVLTPERTP